MTLGERGRGVVQLQLLAAKLVAEVPVTAIDDAITTTTPVITNGSG